MSFAHIIRNIPVNIGSIKVVFSVKTINNIKGTTPKSLIILGQRFEVESWRDVLENTLNTIANLDIDKFNVIASKFSRLLGKDRSKFRAIRQLQNEYFVEVNLSSQSIQKFCNQAIEECELSFDDWKLEF